MAGDGGGKTRMLAVWRNHDRGNARRLRRAKAMKTVLDNQTLPGAQPQLARVER
jgi:hypothetical protein